MFTSPIAPSHYTQVHLPTLLRSVLPWPSVFRWCIGLGEVALGKPISQIVDRDQSFPGNAVDYGGAVTLLWRASRAR